MLIKFSAVNFPSPEKFQLLNVVKNLEKIFLSSRYKDGQRIQEIEDRIQMEGRILRIFQPNISDTGEYICIFEEKGQSYLYADHQGSRTWVTCKNTSSINCLYFELDCFFSI